jgi:mono/diheme cytochrome c family protein
MKIPINIFAIIVLITFASTAIGEVEIKEAPLTWQQAALTDGEELFQELCAACHGASGKGDGPAASAMAKPVSNLTVLASNNDGVFPMKQVEDSITGKTQVVAHGTLDMPVWGQRFEELRPDWKLYRRKALARQRIYNLTLHIESLQVK